MWQGPIVFFLAYLFSIPVQAQSIEALADQVHDVFVRHCAECHGNEQQRKGSYKKKPGKGFDFIFDTEKLVNRRTSSGKRFIVPGAPDQSYLLELITSDKMPYEADEDWNETLRLPDDEKTLVREWIASLNVHAEKVP